MSAAPDDTPTAIPLGISACILGEQVRYDGGHKLDRFIQQTLGAYVRFVPVCPEVGMGLPIPRETLRLERAETTPDGDVRLVAPKSGSDYTARMTRFAGSKMRELRAEALCGYIVQKNSPSCGMERVRVYRGRGCPPSRKGRGLYTQILMERFPCLPVEEDDRLNDAKLRENFIERVFAYRRLRGLFGRRWTIGQLVSFHSREKLLLLAHDRPVYQQLGRLVATAKGRPRPEVADEYELLFLTGLRKLATRRKHTNVLQHAAGYFKKLLDGADRRELQEVIATYHAGHVPLVVPVTLFQHHVRRHDVEYLAQQSYLDPHPTELMLRNHV